MMIQSNHERIVLSSGSCIRRNRRKSTSSLRRCWPVALVLLQSMEAFGWTVPIYSSLLVKNSKSLNYVRSSDPKKQLVPSGVGYIPDGLTSDQYKRIKRDDAKKRQSGPNIDNNIQGLSLLQKLQEYREPSEMMAMSVSGILLSAALVYVLASTNGNIFLTEPETVLGNVVDVTVPVSIDDTVAVVISESIGGVVASFGTNGAALLIKYGIMPTMTGNHESQQQTQEGRENLINKAVAEGDYFIVRSATIPLLQDLGIPIALATVGSVLAATVPYEIIKFGAISKRQRQEEEELLNQLLQEELARKRRQSGFSRIKLPWSNASNSVSERQQELERLQPIAPFQGIDFVSAFGDTIKWLEYDVLKAKLRGMSAIYFGLEVPLAVESGIYGAMAALSAGIWADLCYAISNRETILAAGGDDRLAIQNRLRRYSMEAIRGAALFGAYEAIKTPVRAVVANILSQGASECLGSADVELCLAVFTEDNPVGSQPDAQFQALVISIDSVRDYFYVWFEPVISLISSHTPV